VKHDGRRRRSHAFAPVTAGSGARLVDQILNEPARRRLAGRYGTTFVIVFDGGLEPTLFTATMLTG
jgi:hypothetical protein